MAARDQNPTILPSKTFGGDRDRGFGRVLRTADGHIIVLVSKQMVDGGVQLDCEYDAMELSMRWIKGVLDNLEQDSPAYRAVYDALVNQTLITGIANVNRSTGALTITKVIV